MNTDIRNTTPQEDIKQQEQVIVEQISRHQQFGRMPQRHQPSFTERYHYHYLADTEQPDERED